MKLGAGMIGALVVRPSFLSNIITEKNLWPLYSGAAGSGKSITASQIVITELEKFIPHVKNIFERDNLFYSTIKSKSQLEFFGS